MNRSSGVLAGIAALYLLSQIKFADSKLDTALGKLSYPVFLTHIAVLYAFDFLQAKQILALSPRGLVALQLLVTLLVSLPFAFIDDFMQGLRKRIQRRNTKATPVRQPPSQFEPARI